MARSFKGWKKVPTEKIVCADIQMRWFCPEHEQDQDGEVFISLNKMISEAKGWDDPANLSVPVCPLCEKLMELDQKRCIVRKD